MNVDRLTRLVKLLRDDAANPTGVKFDLSAWAKPNEESFSQYTTPEPDRIGYKGRWTAPAPVIPVSCNTYACALGLAALSPEFKAEGLNYRLDGVYSEEDAARGPVKAGTGTMIPTFNGVDGFVAGAQFFGISSDDSRYFFDPECYRRLPREAEGELYVAQRIEDFINGSVDSEYHPDTAEGEWDEDEDYDGE